MVSWAYSDGLNPQESNFFSRIGHPNGLWQGSKCSNSKATTTIFIVEAAEDPSTLKIFSSTKMAYKS
jgi:hypothetical protein